MRVNVYRTDERGEETLVAEKRYVDEAIEAFATGTEDEKDKLFYEALAGVRFGGRFWIDQRTLLIGQG